MVRLPVPVDSVLEALAKENIQAGFALRKDYPELGECLLVCATETKTPADFDVFVAKLSAALKSSNSQKKSKLSSAVAASEI